MDNQSSRHHYIPKFYAKGFLDIDKKFYKYDKIKDKISKKKFSAKQVFFEWNRNTINTKSGKTAIIEDYYGRLDTECVKVIQELRDKPNTQGIQTGKIIGLLRFFIINIFWRIPAADKITNNYINKISTSLENSKLENDQNHIKLVRPNIPLDIIKNASGLKQGLATSQLFGFEKNLFLIGDYPILFKNIPTTDEELLYGDFIIPISSTRVHRTTEKKLDLAFTFENAFDLNALIIDQSKNHICGPNKDYLEKCIQYWKLAKSRGILGHLKNELF